MSSGGGHNLGVLRTKDIDEMINWLRSEAAYIRQRPGAPSFDVQAKCLALAAEMLSALRKKRDYVMSGLNLGFRIEETQIPGVKLVVYDEPYCIVDNYVHDQSPRPATDEEVAMWLLLEHAETAIQAAEALREHYAEQDDGKLKGGPLAQQMLGDPLLDALDAYRLAAFRAAKEKQAGQTAGGG